MSYPPGRDNGPSWPNGGQPGAGQRGRDTRAPAGDPRVPGRNPRDPRVGPGPGPGWGERPQPSFHPHAQNATRQLPAADPGPRRGAANGRRRGRRGPLGPIGHGLLRGGLGVCLILASAALGAAATIMTKAQPGLTLGLFVLAGTVAAALTVEPRAGRLIFPVPALAYLVAALVSGVAYNRSANQTELAVGAAQWIANGFFVMVLATLLAIALTTVRWFLWRRYGQAPLNADWPAQGAAGPARPVPPDPAGWTDPGPPAARPGQGPPPGFPPAGPAGTRGQNQRPGPGWPPGPGRSPYQRPGPGVFTTSPAGRNGALGA